MRRAPVITVARHRMGTDGQGITSLVCFHGCSLRCRYCLNPFSFDPKTKVHRVTAEQLYETVKTDQLYFLATGGGVTFGGGEPLLYALFLQDFRKLCGRQWHLCAETSLAVPREQVQIAARCIDQFIVDCKDTDPEIYRSYTGRDNDRMLENLQWLLDAVGPERVLVRLPLIPGYNTEEDRQRSKTKLEKIGVTQFDLFTYRTENA